MSNLQKRIEKWLLDPTRYTTPVSLSRSNKLPEDISQVFLNLKSLTCIRKNEITADEIVILCFWLLKKEESTSIEGIIHLGNDFKTEGEVFELGLNIPITRNDNDATFCILVYEGDMPILLDPHDPIGLVTFHQNGGLSVYKGDFRQIQFPLTSPFRFSKINESEFNTERDGCYRLKYKLEAVRGES